MTYVSPDGVAELNSVLDDPQDQPCEGLHRLQSLSDLSTLRFASDAFPLLKAAI